MATDRLHEGLDVRHTFLTSESYRLLLRVARAATDDTFCVLLKARTVRRESSSSLSGPTEAELGGGSNGFAAEFCASQDAFVDSPNSPMIFNASGCATCHTRSITTAAPGTPINGGTLIVAEALGNKTIHPFGDFLLHDVDTGDGIVQNGGAATRNMVRTTPLWGLRTRGRFMHDGLSFNLTDAIRRHGNQAQSARGAFNALTSRDKNKLIAFLLSL